MKSGVEKLSVFFPAYNEEGNIRKTVIDAGKVLDNLNIEWEIIVVDDGSKDRTGIIADKLAEKDKKIKVVHNKPNRGYGGALKVGFNKAKYPWVAFADSDGQFDFSQIKDFIETQHVTDADLVLGVRVGRADPITRKLYTLIWSKILPRLIFGLNVSDYSCGFKMIRKDVYESTLPLVGEEKVTQIEMLVKAQKKGFRFAEVKVKHLPRKFGKQTGADMKVIIKSIKDLIKLWRIIK